MLNSRKIGLEILHIILRNYTNIIINSLRNINFDCSNKSTLYLHFMGDRCIYRTYHMSGTFLFFARMSAFDPIGFGKTFLLSGWIWFRCSMSLKLWMIEWIRPIFLMLPHSVLQMKNTFFVCLYSTVAFCHLINVVVKSCSTLLRLYVTYISLVKNNNLL